MFVEKYEQDFGEIDQTNLFHHVKHASELGLVRENLSQAYMGGQRVDVFEGHILGLTPEGDIYTRNICWKTAMWVCRKVATFIWIILATFIGGLLARYYDEIVLWFS